MKNKIKAYIESVLASHQLPGMAVGVILDGQVLIEEGFGVRNVENGEPVTKNSLFHLASISKLFVATAVMQLVEQGKISLSESPEKYLPYLQINHAFDKELTIEHLLSHTSGFPDVTDYEWYKPQNDGLALERYVRGLQIDLMFTPGERFAYSNIAYEVLGDLIAKVSDMSFEEYVRKNILLPLTMKTSTYFANEVPGELKVSPHINVLSVEVSEMYPYNRIHSPSSTLHSSVAELNLWALECLNDKTSALNAVTLHEMWRAKINVGKSDRPYRACGLGWFSDKHRDRMFLYHSGHDVGFSTYFLLVPEKSIGISVLCNATIAPIQEVVFGILDILGGLVAAPVIPHVMTALGAIYLNDGVDAMRAQYELLQEKRKDEFDFGLDGFLGAAAALLDLNDISQAMDILFVASVYFAENASVYELLARAYFQKGDFENAMKSAQHSLMLKPDNPFLRGQIAGLG